MTETVTYGSNRRPAKAIAGRMRAVPRRSFFGCFIDALRESRSREARRVIAKYAHLQASNGPEIDTVENIGKP